MTIKRTLAALTVAVGALVGATLTAPAHAQPGGPGVDLNRPVFIDHVESGLVLTPNGWNTSPGSLLVAYPQQTDPNYVAMVKWIIEPAGTSPEGNKTYRIRNTTRDTCLQPQDGKLSENTLIEHETCSKSPMQTWVLLDTAPGVQYGDVFSIAPAYDTTLVVTPTETSYYSDQALRLEKLGPYLDQLWRTRPAN